MRYTTKMQATLDAMTDEELGSRLREYVSESNHSSWDAWTKRDLRGVVAFFRDFILFVENYAEPPLAMPAPLMTSLESSPDAAEEWAIDAAMSERQKGDDDGREYGDPRDAMEERLQRRLGDGPDD